LLLAPVGIAQGESFGPYVARLVIRSASEGPQPAVFESLSFTFENRETVNVPAGTFVDCARVRAQRTITFTYYINGIISNLRFDRTDETAWYAPGVGLVKFLASGTFTSKKPDGDAAEVPVGEPFTVTRELASATVAGKSYP